MKKQSLKIAVMAFFVALSVLLQSCSESEDPAMAKGKVQMKATTSESTISSAGRTAASGLVFHQVLLGVRELELESEQEILIEAGVSVGDDDNGDDDYEIEFEGQFVVDLIAGTSNPDFGIADIAPGLYKEIEIKTGTYLENGNSVFVVFEYTPAGASESVVVEYSSNAEFEFEVESHSGFQFSGGDLTSILVLINLDELVGGINFEGATADDDGVVRINSSSNVSIANEIKANLHVCMKAGEDDDDDDKFDDDHDDD